MTRGKTETDPMFSRELDHDVDDICTNPSVDNPLYELIESRLSRRTALKGMAVFATAGAFGAPFLVARPAAAATSSLTFKEIAHASPPIKGVEVYTGPARLDADGNCTVRFTHDFFNDGKIPLFIERCLDDSHKIVESNSDAVVGGAS